MQVGWESTCELVGGGGERWSAKWFLKVSTHLWNGALNIHKMIHIMPSLNWVAMFLEWLQSLKQFFINVSYHFLVASLTLMALF